MLKKISYNLKRPLLRFISNVTQSYPIIEHKYDAVVVGAGGAGLRAAMGFIRKRI